MHKLSIELFGLTLYEPATFVSDIYLTIVCLMFRQAMLKVSLNEHSKLYANFFLFLAFGTIAGGLSHLFGHYISHNYGHVLAWVFSSMGVYFFQRGSAFDYGDKLKGLLNKVFLIQLIVTIGIYFGYQMFGDFVDDPSKVGVPGFLAVSVSMTIGLVGFVFPLHLYKFFKEGDNGSGIVTMGIILSAGAALVHVKHWSLNIYANYNVVAHVILSLCYYIYLLGMKNEKFAKV